jgi:hypothetical protein
MAVYAALLYLPANEYFETPVPGVAHKPSDSFQQFMAEAIPAGVIKSGEALYQPEMATTITVKGGKGGDAIVSDGPYAEAKEVLGGYFIIEVADLDEAIKWAAKMPPAFEGGKVELRPVLPRSR